MARRLGAPGALVGVTLLALFHSGPAFPATIAGSGSSPTANASVGGLRGSHAVQPGSTFAITGGVSGLYPSATTSFALTVTNPFASPITVVSITTMVRSPSSRCAANELEVSAFHGHLVVPAGQSATLSVVAHLRRSAPDGCQGNAFRLTYSGEAERP